MHELQSIKSMLKERRDLSPELKSKYETYVLNNGKSALDERKDFRKPIKQEGQTTFGSSQEKINTACFEREYSVDFLGTHSPPLT